MHSNSTTAALAAPSNLEMLRRARVLGRVNVSNALAGVLAAFAFPREGRDHETMLVGGVAERCAAAGLEAR